MRKGSIQKAFLVVLMLVTVLGACTPQRRLNRLISRHPELIRIDTVSRIDTFIRPKFQRDTVFKNSRDTVFFQTEKFTTKYFFNGTDSTVYISTLVPADTGIKRMIFTYPTIQQTPPAPWWNRYFDWLIIALLLIIGIKLFLIPRGGGG